MASAPIRRFGVCMVTYAMPPEHSGAAKQAITLARHLAANGVQIFFVTQRSAKSSLGIDKVGEFNVIRIRKENLFWKCLAPPRVFWTLFRERKRYSILHVHGVGYLGKIAAIFGKLFGKKVILKMTMFTEDDAMSIKSGRLGWINFFFFCLASHYIAITDSFYQSCMSANISKSKVSHIPNGVDTERFRPLSLADKQKLRNTFDLPSDKVILVYAGIIRPEKGIDFLLDTIELLGKRRRDITLLLMGPLETWLPPKERVYASLMAQRMEEMRRRGLVYFRGKVESVQEYFQAADIFVSASLREGFPNVLIEAMATGLPPVVVEIPGVHDSILQDGVDGIVVRKRDVETFAGRINELVDNEDLRRSLSASALNKVTSKYSVKKITNDYLSLYDRLTA